MSEDRKRPGPKPLDQESQAMLYEGLNVSQYAVLFKMDVNTVKKKLHEVNPSGKRNGVDIWDLAEAAPYLVKPAYDIEKYIKQMNHADLPKQLTKEFWAGLKSRQEYLTNEGDLWPTEKVIADVGELVKLIKVSVRLMRDRVEKTTELSDRQRKLIDDLGDDMLSELLRMTEEKFKPKPKAEPEEKDDDDEL